MEKSGLFGLDRRVVLDLSKAEVAALERARDIADQARRLIVARYPDFQDSDDDVRLGMVAVSIDDALGEIELELLPDRAYA